MLCLDWELGMFQNISQKESIPVGCVQLACWPEEGVASWHPLHGTLPFIEPPSWYPFTATPPSWNPLQGNPPGQHTPCGQTNTSENITFLQLCLLVVIKMEIFRYMFLKIHTDIRMLWLLQCKIGFSLLSYACCCLQKCYCRLKPKHM